MQGEKIWREELSRIIELAVEKEATRLVNKKYQSSVDSLTASYVPEFRPVDENDFTFMGRLLRHILKSMSKGFYLHSMSSWYDMEGNQVFGLRFIHFLHENLGTTFLQGLDKLVVYNLVNELRQFYRDYSLLIGGGNFSQEVQQKFKKKETKQLQDALRQSEQVLNANLENLDDNHLRTYNNLIKLMPIQVVQTILPRLLTIGKLQQLRRLLTKQIHFAARVESS